MYRKEISERDLHIQVLKQDSKDLSIKITEAKLNKEGKSVTDMVRQCKIMSSHIYVNA